MLQVQHPLLDAAKRMSALVRQGAEGGERGKRLPEETVRAFVEAGFFRMCRPTAYGGLALDPLTLMHVIEELARGDGAAGWCAMISGSGCALEAFLPLEGGKEILSGPQIVTGGVLAPSGRATEVEGGYKISGRWGMASGCQHCDWLHAACLVFDEGAPGPRMGPMGPEWIVPYVPAKEVTIHDTWDVSGLCGTGSHDFEIKEAFVPQRRVIRFPPPPTEREDALYKFPLFSLLPVALASTALGIARAALDEIIAVAAKKTPFGMMSSLATRASAQIAVSQAEGMVRGARAYLLDTVADAWAETQAGKQLTIPQRAGIRLAATTCVESCVQAVDRVYTTGGGSALYAKSPLQRCFRDIHAITQNFIVAPPTHELFGKVLLGVEADTMLI
jgi:alkylation response protein AidB-like acyl-CoA dehydrogenase